MTEEVTIMSVENNTVGNLTNKNPGDEKAVTFEDALKATGFGKYNYRLLAICTYSLLASTSETFSIGIVTTASQCDLDLDVDKIGLICSVPIFGVVVSAHFWGFLADTRGRRFSLIVSTAATCMAGVIASFSNSWIFLGVIKFIGAIFGSGTNAIAFTFLGEALFMEKRQTFIIYAYTGMLSFQAYNALLSYIILRRTFSYYIPLLGFAFRPWRLFVMIIGLFSGINLLLVVFFTYESPKFHFANGEHEKGLNTMQKIYTDNTSRPAETYPVKHVILNDEDYKTKKRNFFHSVWDQTIPLFSKKYLKSTFLIFFCAIPSYCIPPPFSVWLPFIVEVYNESKDPDVLFCDMFQINKSPTSLKYFSSQLSGSMASKCDDHVADLTLIVLVIFAIYQTLCSLISIVAIRCIGKKLTYIVTHSFALIMCLMINRFKNSLVGIIALFGMTSLVTGMGIATSYAIELFPTCMRAMSVCLCILTGRIVSIAFFGVIGAQLETNCNNFLFITAGVITLGGTVGLFLPSDMPSRKTPRETVRK